MKLQNLICLSLFISTIAQAETYSGEIKVTDTRDSIRYKYDSISSEYSLDVRPLLKLSLSVPKEETRRLDCDSLKDLIESAGTSLRMKDYVTRGLPVRVGVMVSAEEEIRSEIFRQLQDRGVHPTNLIDRTNVRFDNVRAEYTWMKSSLTVKAGDQALYSGEEHLKSLLHSSSTLSELNTKGFAMISVEHRPLLCDLLNKKVELSLTVAGVQYSGLKNWTSISSAKLRAVNQAVLKNQSYIQRNAQVAHLSQDESRLILSSSLLAFSMVQNGLSSQNVKADEFTQIFSAMYNDQRLPAILDARTLENLVSDLSTPDYNPENISINQIVNLEVR